MELIRLGDIIHFIKGKKPKVLRKVAQEGDLPYVDIKAAESGGIENYTNGEKCVPCEEGDLLIVCDGSRSGLVLHACKGYVGSTLAKISADGVLNEYLRYFIMGLFTMLNTQMKGTGTPHLNKDILNEAKLYLPPLAEQERIVARIEELFSELDQAEEMLRKTQKELELYQQSVYVSAYKNLDDTKPITDYFEVTGGLTKNSKRNQYILKYPYLRVANVYYDKLDLTEIKQIGVTEAEIEKTLLKKGDLLVVEGNGSKSQIGRMALWDGSIPKCLHQNHLIKLRATGSVLPEYALYYLISKAGRDQIIKVAKSTSGLYTLSTNKVKKLQIPICEFEIQEKIIKDIQEKLSVCETINQSMNITLQQSKALRQSILKKAFEGGL